MASKESSLVQMSFPMAITLFGKEAVMDKLGEDKYEEAIDLFVAAAARGDGIGQDEFRNRDDILKKIKSGDSFYMHKSGDQKMVALYLQYPSVLSRSENPVHASGYFIVNPIFKGKGVATNAFSSLPDVVTAYGYRGSGGRTACTARTILPIMRSDIYIIGAIPRSVRLAKEGLVDDLIVCKKNMNDEEITVRDNMILHIVYILYCIVFF